MTIKKIRPLFLFSVLMILIAGTMIPWFISWLINSDSVRSYLSDSIYEKSGMRLTTQNIHVDLFPKISLQINDIQIKLSPDTVLSIGSVHVFPNLFSLINKNLKTEEIRVKNSRILYVNHPENALEAETLFPLALLEMASRGNEVFTYFSKDQEDINIRVENFQTQYFKQLDAHLTLSKKSPGISAQITITHPLFDNKKLADLVSRDRVTIHSVTAKKIQIDLSVQDNGMADGQFSVHDVVILPGGGAGKPLMFKPLNGTFSFSDRHAEVHLTPTILTYPKGTVSIDFSYSDKETSLVFSGEMIDITEAREASLNILSGTRVCRELFNILHGGTAEHVRVSFHNSSPGDLFSGQSLGLTGTIRDGTSRIPQTDLVVRGIDADAAVEDGILSIDIRTGALEDTLIQNGTLAVDLIHFTDHPFKGRFKLDVNLSSLPPVLISLLPETTLSKELERIKSIQGKAGVDLSLSLKTGQKQVEVIVMADAITAKGTYARIPGQIIIDEAQFEYRDNRAIVKNFSGQIHSQSLYNINTTLTLEAVPRILIDSGTAMIQLETLLPWLMMNNKIKKIISPVKGGIGQIYVDHLRLNGPVSDYEDWIYDITGTFVNMDLDAGDTQRSVTGLSGAFHISDQSVQIDQLNTHIHQTDFLSVSSNPSEVPVIDSMNTPFQITNGRFVSKSGFSEFSGELKFSGTVNMAVKLQKNEPGDIYKLQTLSIEDIPFTDMSIQMDPDRAWFDFSGKLDSRTLKEMIQKDSPLYEKIFKLTRNKPFTIESGLENQIKGATESMDISHFLNQTASTGISWKKIKGKTILLDIDTLYIKKLKFDHFRARVLEKDQQTMIHISSADWCSLLTRGLVTVSKDRVTCGLTISESQNNDLGPTLLCLFNQPDLILGPYTLKGQLSAEGTLTDFYKAFQGNLTFHATDGRIFRLTLLSRILSFLNVSKLFKGTLPDVSQEGFAYNQIDISATVKDNRINLDSAVIDGKDMTLVFTGWIDPVSNQLDLTCLVAPFKTVDLIISKIPIISTLFNDRLISVPVKATGKINDPVIIPLHPSSIGEGLINMMVNILKTPVTLIEENL